MNAKTLTLAPALLLSLVTLSAVGCAKSGASPTEPVSFSDNATFGSVTAESRAQEPAAAPQQVAGNALTSNREAEPGDDHGGGNGGGHHNGGGADDTVTGAQFRGAVASITGSTINLASGAKVTVNAATAWSARGDLRNLAALRASFNRNQHPRIEGRGTRQANGSISAKTLKAEF